MKIKIVPLTMFLSLTVMVVSLSVAAINTTQKLTHNHITLVHGEDNECAAHFGNHYNAVAATKSAPGINEFCVCCNCHKSFVVEGSLPSGFWSNPTDLSSEQIADIVKKVEQHGEEDSRYVRALDSTISWLNYDGTLIYSENVACGVTPTYTGDIPVKPSDYYYGYEFTGWSPEIVSARGDASYTAQFNSVNKYTITWVDGNDETLLAERLTYGSTPSYSGETPTKTATAQYTYTFTGWSPAISMVTKDTTYYAQFRSDVNEYTVVFKNYNGTVLQSSEMAYGSTPSYTGSTPTRTADAQYTYTFAGWDKDISIVTGDVTYTATYNTTINTYQITWVDGNGETLKTEQVAYGATPSYSGATPTKTATAQYTYTFTGWSPTITPVTAARTYTAQFNSTVRTYTVTFSASNGSWSKSSISSVPYGTSITRSNNIVTVGSYGSATYTAAGTTVSQNPGSISYSVPSSVGGNTSISASTAMSTRTYTVKWIGPDGSTVLETDSGVKYGDKLTYNSSTPTKSYDNNYHYSFNKWALNSTSGSTVTSGTTTCAGSTSTTEIKIYAVMTATAHNHNLTGGAKRSDATCTAAATYYYKCSCGHQGTNYYSSGSALGHSYDTYISSSWNGSTCTATIRCSRCNGTTTKQKTGTRQTTTTATCVTAESYRYYTSWGEYGGGGTVYSPIYTGSVNPNNHVGGTSEWYGYVSSANNKHWQTCNSCGAKLNEGSHTFTTASGHNECSVCGMLWDCDFNHTFYGWTRDYWRAFVDLHTSFRFTGQVSAWHNAWHSSSAKSWSLGFWNGDSGNNPNVNLFLNPYSTNGQWQNWSYQIVDAGSIGDDASKYQDVHTIFALTFDSSTMKLYVHTETYYKSTIGGSIANPDNPSIVNITFDVKNTDGGLWIGFGADPNIGNITLRHDYLIRQYGSIFLTEAG